MVSGDCHDEARIVFVSLIKIVAIHADVAGKVHHVPQVIVEGRLAVTGQVLRILRHQRRNKILLLASVVPGISHGMKDQSAFLNRGNVSSR